ncbi:uncharacterized protein L969DRAFT_46705 [Mixia osmundae IAM 14324]|uniref:FAS1 domain-containing protein n=1 Tax=Mixia osmundae (strain CBS 9802 / IAM 14324 / JCM 22182 / KY 12970) TaxID=764103 RepID=G7DUA3_MIXOS|nr:uncharacterized protein L969DRAFT_46705 [Mixia osmundae IAM 14324]KEI41034.1 hypothetical protein L969DRAFT_46705 [Mixia osmundae IAM 14324]GAA94163.1 hypothetical protein E5Q_00811 [Mixia osmundae IAM 14324]
MASIGLLVLLAGAAHAASVSDILTELGHTKTSAWLAKNGHYQAAIFNTSLGPISFCSPSNKAWEALMPSANNDTFIGETYMPLHIVRTRLDASKVAIAPARSIYRSGLLPPATFGLNLGAGLPSPLVFQVNSSGSLLALQTAFGGNITITPSNQTSDDGVSIFSADMWFDVPGDILLASQNANGADASDFGSVLQAASPSGDLLVDIQSSKALTVLMPNNDALAPTKRMLGSQPPALLTMLIKNHIINGTAVYSTQIEDNLEAVTAAGSAVTFHKAANGDLSVAIGTTAAVKIVKSDILGENLVVHTIAGVLKSTTSDDGKAKDANKAYLDFDDSGKIPAYGEIDSKTPIALSVASTKVTVIAASSATGGVSSLSASIALVLVALACAVM